MLLNFAETLTTLLKYYLSKKYIVVKSLSASHISLKHTFIEIGLNNLVLLFTNKLLEYLRIHAVTLWIEVRNDFSLSLFVL